tara:strand:- start:305 stop:562 length:258 start_codon:yes stop_codon:yes gene_type:complete
MIKLDEKSNAQSWELEITCKNKKYLDEVVKAVLSYGMIDFEVENVECLSNSDGREGRYTVFMWCRWFNNLASISKDLKKIEKRLG